MATDKKKIAVLLPFKDNFTNSEAGSASIWIKDFNKNSSFKKDLFVCGQTEKLNDLIQKKNYINLKFKKKTLKSKNISYVDEFIKINLKHNFKLVEIHNRPSYLLHLIKKNIDSKFVLIFHNNPLNLGGSKSLEERNFLITKCEKLIFVSNWVKEKFFEGFEKRYNNKCITIYPSIDVIKKFPRKKKIISFVGKLNKSKGFHIFGSAIVKILNKHKEWKAVVIGDEPREKYNFKHKNLEYKGWIAHNDTLKIYNYTSISVVPSFWEEPFGRTAMEAASRGCATIISKKGGLVETIASANYLSQLNSKNLFKQIEYLIKNKKERNLKIIHISNFGNRLFNRLYFISIAKKLSNGLIRQGHDVINISDRDTIRFNRYVTSKSGIDYFNNLIFETVKNYSPDLLLLGHSDNISYKTLEKIKGFKNNLKIAQWFEDNLHDSGPDPDLNKRRLLKNISYIDTNFITTHPSALNFLDKKKSFYYLPIPVDKNIEKLNIYENSGSVYDVFFTMSHGVNRGILKENKNDERYPFISKLLEKNPDILFDIYGYKNRQPIWSEDFYNIIQQSKMGLNLSRTNSVKYYTSNRISSLIGNGLMTFVDIKTQLNDFFDENEVVFYKNIDDLSRKLNFFKKNDHFRKKIAHKGQKKYFNYFNSYIVADYMISRIFGFNQKDKKEWMNS